MKTFNKIILFVLCVIFLVSAGCADKPDDIEQNIQETETYFIENGNSDYKIVIADSPRGYEAHAAQEMVDFVEKATSVTLPIVKASAVTVTVDSKLLILGETDHTTNAGVSAPKNTYGARGFVIKQKDTNVYLVGGDTAGTLYAVYDFLHYQLGFEVYASNEIAINKGVVNNKLLAFDMSEIPDIAHIQSLYEYWGEGNAISGHRMRYNHHTESFVNATGQPWHNSLAYASPEAKAECVCHKESGLIYRQAHPKWYTDTEAQFHYTAHGDPKEMQALQDHIYNQMVFFIERDFSQGKYYEQIGFMHEDHGDTYAKADTIIDEDDINHVDSIGVLKSKYGNAYPAAMLIQFINPVQERLTQYMSEKQDGRKMSITVFAYLDTEAAPVKIDQDGNEVPIDDSVVLHPDVNIFIAPIKANYFNDYESTGMAATINAWKALAKNFSFWFYDYFFNTNTFFHVDSTYSLQTYFKAAYDVHATYVFVETPLSLEAYYPFGKLKTYIISKLGWDVDQDVHVLIENFFNNYYKDAAGYMKQYFKEVTAYYAYIKETTEISGVVGSSGADIKNYWKEGTVSGWMDLIDKAYEEIEMIKFSDKALYEELRSRILYDSLMPRYILLKHFAKEAFTDESFVKEFAQFKADCASLGVVRAADIIVEDLVLTR